MDVEQVRRAAGVGDVLERPPGRDRPRVREFPRQDRRFAGPRVLDDRLARAADAVEDLVVRFCHEVDRRTCDVVSLVSGVLVPALMRQALVPMVVPVGEPSGRVYATSAKGPSTASRRGCMSRQGILPGWTSIGLDGY